MTARFRARLLAFLQQLSAPLATFLAFTAGLCTVMSSAAAGEAGNEVALRSRFANPPAESRILKIIHPWPDDPEAQDGLIRRLLEQGFGGVVCNVAFADYLESATKWEAFRRGVTEARRLGMALWLYDEKGYPSGNAGGLVLRDHPDWEAQGLLIADAECGPGRLTLDSPPGRLVVAAAFPLTDGQIQPGARVDLSEFVREGRLSWEAPAGRWRVMLLTENRLYEGTHAELNLHEHIPYINLLRAEPTARFLEVTHDRYAQHLGPDLGRYFVATFTDEPSLMSLFLRRMPYRPLPWSPDLATEFRKRRGYPLEPILLELVADSGPGGQRHRYDFWQTIGELVSANYFGQLQTWCRRHHLQSGGHLLAEEGIVGHVPLYGDFFRCVRHLDAPSIDCLTSVPAEVPWFIARLVASAAELEGRRVVMCETSDHSQVWRPAGDARPRRIVTEAEIRGTCNRLIVSGVNAITSYYSFTDLPDESLRRLNEWVGRCCTLLQGGHQVADVAVVYPVESLWTRFVPAQHWANASPAANRIEQLYRTTLDSLFAAHRDLTIVDSRALMEARVERGTLVLGDLRWRVVVLPGVDTLPLAAWRNLAEFVEGGGVVVALAARPTNSESEFPSRKVQAFSRQILGEIRNDAVTQVNRAGGAGVFLPPGAEALLPLVLEGVLEADVSLARRGDPIRATHRRVGGREVYFLINDSPQPWQGEVRLSAAGPGTEWDPATGQVRALDGSSAPRLALAPFGGTILSFPAARRPARHRVEPGPLPNLVVQPLAPAQPVVGRGEFVREVFGPDPGRSQPQRPVWRAQARLTRGQTDTFLFVRFPYGPGLDLENADCLEFESWVPDGQRAPTQLLVILQEQGGGDFYASTPRSLGAPGHERVFIPLSRFELAGWSRDADGLLDLKRVSEIRIGWGGYYGAEGEELEFSLTSPRQAHLAAP